MSNTDLKQVIRSCVNSAYQLQEARKTNGNRLVAAFRTKLGVLPGKKESAADEDTQLILEKLRAEYCRITDSITMGATKKRLKESDFKGYELIQTEAEFALTRVYINLLKEEEAMFKSIEKTVKKHPLWDAFFAGVKGCGPAMAAVCISEIDIHKCKYPSSLHAYAGVDVVINHETGIGEGRSKKANHLVDVSYIDRNGKEASKKSITYNPFLKTKVVGVLGDIFIKMGSEYREIYDNYKFRLQNREDLKDASKLRIHRMAVRYMIKIFLTNLYKKWREVEGLVVHEEYRIAKLGQQPHTV